MTRRHIETLVNHNKRQHQSTKQDILNLIKRVGGPIEPHDIKAFLDNDAYHRFKKEYEEGKLSKSEFKTKLQEEQISLRTIHRHLAELLSEGLIVNEGGGKYCLSVNAKSDIRYFANEFGVITLGSMMSHCFATKVNTSNDVQNNLSSLVKTFGTYVLYCLIEAGRPIKNNNNKNMAISASRRDTLISKFIANVFPTEWMYDYFLAVIQYMFDNSNNKSCSGSSKKSAFEILRELNSERMKYVEQNGLGDKSLYELDQLIIESLDNELMKIIGRETYSHLTVRGEINLLEEELKLNNEPLSEELKESKSSIEANSPKNKAVSSSN